MIPRLLRQAASVAVAVAVVFALVDLWQAALLRPGFLSAVHVLLLFALYLFGAFVAALGLLAADVLVRRLRPPRAAAGAA